jgi:hypothetical protein
LENTEEISTVAHLKKLYFEKMDQCKQLSSKINLEVKSQKDANVFYRLYVEKRLFITFKVYDDVHDQNELKRGEH